MAAWRCLMTEVATSESTAVGNRDRLYIDGQWVERDGRGRREVITSATGEVCATVPEGSAEAANRAVAAARAAFDGWAATNPAQRAGYLDKIKAGLKARAADLLQVIA